MRPLFFEYPNDPGSWNIDDQYMFGSDLLVAPMFDSSERRRVYLPPGKWIDYQSGRVYVGSNWQTVSLTPRGRDFVLRQDPLAGKVKWTIKVQKLVGP